MRINQSYEISELTQAAKNLNKAPQRANNLDEVR